MDMEVYNYGDEDQRTISTSLSSEDEDSYGSPHPVCHLRINGDCLVKVTWEFVKRDMIYQFGLNNSLAIFFYSFKDLSNVLNRCHCLYLPQLSCSLMLEDDVIVDDIKETLSVAFIPLVSNLTIFPLVYYLHQIKKNLHFFEYPPGVELPEKYFINLRNIFGSIMIDFKGCIILFGNAFFTRKLIFLMKRIKEFFHLKRLPVIAGTLSNLWYCGDNVCREVIGAQIIIMKSKDLEAWTLSLDESCKTEEEIRMKFIDLKNRVQLKKYSLSFMYFCRMRDQLLKRLESVMYKEYFPDVPLHLSHGKFGYVVEEDFDELYAKARRFEKFPDGKETYLMIITYN